MMLSIAKVYHGLSTAGPPPARARAQRGFAPWESLRLSVSRFTMLGARECS
jgi:hypothetical protein